MGDRFELRREADGPRYCLMATLFTPATCSRCSSHDGAWHAARFEWTFGKNEPVPY